MSPLISGIYGSVPPVRPHISRRTVDTNMVITIVKANILPNILAIIIETGPLVVFVQIQCSAVAVWQVNLTRLCLNERKAKQKTYKFRWHNIHLLNNSLVGFGKFGNFRSFGLLGVHSHLLQRHSKSVYRKFRGRTPANRLVSFVCACMRPGWKVRFGLNSGLACLPGPLGSDCLFLSLETRETEGH